MNDPAVSDRKTRSDKERNRSHILDVATEFFAEQGVDGPMHDIAKRAGFGPGTLYRHFPTREDLLAALLEARWDELFARRDVIERSERDSAAALQAWLDALSDYVTVFDGLPDPLRVALTKDTSPLAITCETLVDTTGQFLAAAQRDGKAHSWVGARELFLGVLASVWVGGAVLADEASTSALRPLLRAGWEKPSVPHLGHGGRADGDA
ncbi:transcriptional regulator, TetR family [Microbacterium sp. LKL04]|uniref:TetR/AcrR family transcriptional regulator n=1 Tax=Microbacterium sp. LKL04 TaxID=912630 RepID=UPI000875D234|nr:TetR/AcrR family transcriptional regulator [Microbacterium sp. LKL04]SCY55915.1 transcriptional regulator, TetR family [Microbacterium sp. LKL04]